MRARKISNGYLNMHEFIDFALHHWELVLALVVILILLLTFELHGKLTGTSGLSPHEATLLINREDAIVLDIRDSNNFAKGHITRAINIAHADLNAKLKQLDKYKEKPIIICFVTGQPHNKVGRVLKENGFTKIYHLKGGITAWQDAGLPLTKD